jgi:hypothetical protein
MEALAYWPCCLGGCGVVGGAGGRSWRMWKETRALRAEEVGLGVCGEVECGLWEVGAVEKGVV